MTTPALWVAIAAMVPLMLAAAYIDVRTLKIPNWISVAVLLVFVVTGLWGLPWQTFLWALGAGFALLVFFFVLYTALDMAGFGGNMGAGDLKLMAALIPFIAWRDAFTVSVIFLITVVVLAVVFTILWRRQDGRGESKWASLNQTGTKYRKRTPPMGVSLASSMLVYLGLLGGRALGML